MRELPGVGVGAGTSKVAPDAIVFPAPLEQSQV